MSFSWPRGAAGNKAHVSTTRPFDRLASGRWRAGAAKEGKAHTSRDDPGADSQRAFPNRARGQVFGTFRSGAWVPRPGPFSRRLKGAEGGFRR